MLSLAQLVTLVPLGISPTNTPVLVSSHAPFVWGKNAAKAVENGIVLEEVAGMAMNSLALNPSLTSVPGCLLDKHFLRKHGAGAYYGQGGGAAV